MSQSNRDQEKNLDAHNASELRVQVRKLSERNSSLASLLQSSRNKLQQLAADVNELAEPASSYGIFRSEEHTSELQSPGHLLCPLLLRPLHASTLLPYTTLFRSHPTRDQEKNLDAHNASELRVQVRKLSERNSSLASLLQSSRNKLQQLAADVNELAEPASSYGIF